MSDSSVELADELEAACKVFIARSCDASHWEELKKAREKLEDILWVNKEAIISYLRSSVPRPEASQPAALALPPRGDAVREALASAMMRCGLATGHGDTFESLLSEMEWQVQRFQNRLAALPSSGAGR